MKVNELQKQKKSSQLDNWSISKENIATKWIDLEKDKKNLKIKQGEIYLCELGENIGYEMCKKRPVLIVSETRYSQQGQAVVVPLTKNTRPQKTHYTLKMSNYDFLTFDSCVKTEQIRSIASIRLIHRLGQITDEDFCKVKNRLKTLFSV